MKKIIIAGAGIAALAAAAGGIAIAQTAQPRVPVAADGSVKVSDLRQQAADRFARLDANKDNQISRQEIQARAGEVRERRGDGPRGRMGARRGGPGGEGGGLIDRADANRDGAVTQAEFAAQATDRFQRLDANHDGRIVREETQALRDRFGGRRGEAGRFGGRGGGRLAMLDADHDGNISRAEFDRAQAERLGRLDANRDGNISREERRANRPGGIGPGRQRQF